MIKLLSILNLALFGASILLPPIDIPCPVRGAVNKIVFSLFFLVSALDLFFVVYSQIVLLRKGDKKGKFKKLKYLSLFYLCLMLVFGLIFFVWSRALIC